jgi:phosphatidate cytidylyltransferase
LLGFGFMLWVTTDAFKIGDVALYEIGWWLLIVMLIALPIMEIVVSRQFNLKNLGLFFFRVIIHFNKSWFIAQHKMWPCRQ